MEDDFRFTQEITDTFKKYHKNYFLDLVGQYKPKFILQIVFLNLFFFS